MFWIFQDFEGQGRAERLSRVIITLFGIVGLIWGGIVQQFSQTIFILAAGVLLTLIVSPFASANANAIDFNRKIHVNFVLINLFLGGSSTMANLSSEAIELAKAEKYRWWWFEKEEKVNGRRSIYIN